MAPTRPRALVVGAVLATAASALLAGGARAAQHERRPPTPVGGAGAVVEVRIGDNVFRPKLLVVLPGTIVRWTNRGRNDHDVVPNKGSRFGVDLLEPEQAYSHRFAKPGRFAYYCSFHGAPGAGQHAKIEVVERPKGA